MTPRDLFPLEAGEKRLEEGVYQYRENGQLTAIREPWCRHRHSRYGVITRALRSDGEYFVLALKQYRDGDENAVQLIWMNLAGESVRITADYRIAANRLRWRRQGGDWQEQELVEGLLFFPLMRVFTGEVIDGLLDRGGAGPVLVPSIVNPAETATLFEPLFSERFAETVRDAESLAGCETYRYGGAQYEDGALFWLDGERLLQRYEWQQAEDCRWQVILADHRGSSRPISPD